MGGEDLQFTPGTRRFFKVMMPGFTQKLNLPKKLYNKLSHEKSEQGIIKSSLGTCQIKVYRNQELGLISFDDGWPDFVHLHALCIGDFVVFEHLGNLHFNAFVFDQSACEKDHFLIHPKEEPQQKPQPQRKQMEDTSDMSAPFESKNTFFILTMKHCSANVYIPPKFRRSNGLKNRTKVVLRDPSGRKWAVNLLGILDII